MLQPIRTKLLGDLYYDNTPREYVAPPIAERQALMDKKEEEYIYTKNAKNEMDRVLNQMPYLESNPDSKLVYDNLKAKHNEILSGINEDNYEDKVLDVNQYANDFYNKLGGYELITEAQQASAYNAEVDKVILDPERAAWTKQQSQLDHKGITQRPDGTFTRPNFTGRGIVADVDTQAKLLKLMDGWMADKYITRNPATGRITVNKEIPGYLGLVANTEVSEAELFSAGLAYLEADPESKRYIDEYAEFQASQIPPTGEALNSILSSKVKEQIFGNAAITNEELDNMIRNGEINPRDIILQYSKSSQKVKALEAPVAKFGYKQEELTTLKDELLLESIKASNATQQAEVANNVAITVEPFSVKSTYDVADVKQLQLQKAQAVEKRLVAQGELNSYRIAIKNGGKGMEPAQLELMQQNIQRIDEEIAGIEQQEKQINQQAVDLARKANFNVEETYKKGKAESVQQAKELNKTSLQADRNSLIDVTDLVSINGNKAVLAGKSLDVNSGNMRSSFSNDIILKDGKYYLRPSESGYDKDLLAKLDNKLFTETGSLNLSRVPKSYYDTPDEEEFKSMVVEAYAKDESASNALGVPKDYYVSDNKLVFSASMLNGVDMMKKKHGTFEEMGGISGTQDLSYFMVSGETTKTASKQYVEFRKNLQTTLKATPEQFEVDGRTLADVLVNDYGLPDASGTYIDWDKTNAEYLIQRDRNKGIQYGINVILTKEGEEATKGGWFSSDTKSPNAKGIKLVATNEFKHDNGEDDQVREFLFGLYTDVASTNSAHKKNLALNMGEYYANTRPEGKDLDTKNLYILPAGESETWTLNKGTDREEKLRITAVARSARQGNIRNVDYKLESGNEVWAIDDKGNSGYIDKDDLETSTTYKPVYFNSPADIKQVVGATLLQEEYQFRTTNTAQNYVNTYNSNLSDEGYRTTPTGAVEVFNYANTLNTMKSMYGGVNYTTQLKNSKGETKTFETRVPQKDLVDLRPSYGSAVSAIAQYPYVHKNIVSYIDTILSENNLVIDGGFRGEATHFGLKGSAKDSAHKYAHSVDFRANKEGLAFFNKVQNDGALLKKYGIAKIFTHTIDGKPHIHAEFITDSI